VTTDELRERIRLGEDARTELKDERVHTDALEAAIVSFANAAGGVIAIGVADDGETRGVADADALILRIDNVCRNSIEPPYTLHVVEKHALDGRVVLALHVPRGTQRPYRTSRGVYYVRAAASKRMATRQELLDIYQSSLALHPDEIPVEDAGVDEIDRSYLLGVRPELLGLREEGLVRTLVNARILSPERRLTLAGLLCFGQDPQRFRPYARVTAIRHRGVAICEEFLERREIGGKLEAQVRDAMAFVRANVPDLPAPAVDEAIVNALVHRDYLAPAQVRILVFEDRLEVVSPGAPLDSVSVDEMQFGCHVVRNARIFAHLSRLRLTTDAGRGVPSMIGIARERGLPEPALVARGSEFRVVFRRAAPRPS
jgi:ATP-dependent DNA helicase RecG